MMNHDDNDDKNYIGFVTESQKEDFFYFNFGFS